MGNAFRNILIVSAWLTAAYGGMKAVAKKRAEDESINDDNPHLKDARAFTKEVRKVGVYEGKVKPALDQALSFGGLILFSPLFGLISLAVYLDDPGPVFFTQKRIGKDKRYIMIHKFRSMKMSTPHDVPTHQLAAPDQYITRVGRALRRTSLDEIPQIWDIFRGRLSVIGPRPALWNQDDLVAKRDKYGANNVMPGLTGWAQINGRDELEIGEKAKLDGEYVKKLSFSTDVKCFFGTVKSVLRHEGVVEGGTGGMKSALRSGVPEKDPISELGCDKTYHIDWERKARVLITGADSYIGERFKAYAENRYGGNFVIDTLDLKDESWRSHSFTDGVGHPYDAVFHVAGIAHADVGNANDEAKERYYRVNTDLAIKTAQKAKEAGVKQFIFMSSMIVYGDAEYIDRRTKPNPANFYGDSKWQADRGVRNLADDKFAVAVLRPPMIYGKGAKGNYPMLSKIARKVRVFPDYENKRSMLYIENFCEFLCGLTLSGEGGVYFPQNREYSRTSEVVKSIGESAKKRVWTVRWMNPAIDVAKRLPVKKIQGLARKAFGNNYYAKELSAYKKLDYQKVELEESIRRTETKTH